MAKTSPPANAPTVRKILVTGDVIVDHHLYKGNRLQPGRQGGRGTQLQTSPGGAALLYALLDQVRQHGLSDSAESAKTPAGRFEVALGVDTSKLERFPPALHSFGVWSPKRRSARDDKQVWRLTEAQGYGESCCEPVAMPVHDDVLRSPADILVLDDGGLSFRSSNSSKAWPAALGARSKLKPQWIVLKTSSPLARGDLWRTVSDERFRDRTIVVTSVTDVRSEPVRVTRGISWERTALDLVDELNSNPVLVPLKRCRHCIISLGSEGAIHLERGKAPTYRLIFDPAHLEGEWQATVDGEAFGYMSCLVAGIVSRLVCPPIDSKTKKTQDPEIDMGIIAGLQAGRAMRIEGHGEVGASKPALPVSRLAEVIVAPDNEQFFTTTVPVFEADQLTKRECWTIMAGERDPDKDTVQPLVGIARRVALFGPSELKRIPYQRFGKLFTVDRSEIESLRNVQRAIRAYEKYDSGKKPLSIAVFGAPGSGKSFGVKQIAKAVLGKKVPILEFNLSQLAGPDDLIGALHQVRDKALGPDTPVVFWDEFDSREYDWLQYLLAPMQDGAFQAGQITHPIGKCVFIFAGGTSCDFEHFGPRKQDTEKVEAFKRLKGPDFKSRLNIYLNVMGPNRRPLYDEQSGEWQGDMTDICYPIRRALLLRSFVGLEDDELLEIDDGMLTALLEVNEYAHGARSMGNVVTQIMRSGLASELRRSDLPPAEVISMHVDYDEFLQWINRDLEFKRLADELAPYVHGSYVKHIKATDGEGVYLDEFKKLSEEIKDDNRAAAMRIPRILALVGLYVVRRDESANGKPAFLDGHVEKILDKNIDRMAKAEHEGWMTTRLANGWRYGKPRRDKEKIHHALVPYNKLEESDVEKDKDSVQNYKDILALVNYTITNKPPLR